MPNGRLFCVTLEGKVLELDGATGKVLRTINSGMNGCYSVQGLPGGRVLVASYNDGRVAELDSRGKAVWQYSLPSAYHAERLGNGHTLISSHGGMRFVEVDRKGKLLTERNTNGSNVWRVHRR
jgi:outer membrane protein assembly factor BamB